MEEQNNIAKSRKGKHLMREECQQIETLRRAGLAARAIAELPDGRSARTIRRELAGGTVDQMNSDLTMRQEYSYDVGQMKLDEYAKNKGRALKIGSNHEFARYKEHFRFSGEPARIPLTKSETPSVRCLSGHRLNIRQHAP